MEVDVKCQNNFNTLVVNFNYFLQALIIEQYYLINYSINQYFLEILNVIYKFDFFPPII